MAVEGVLAEIPNMSDDEKKTVASAIRAQLPPPPGWGLSVVWIIVLSGIGLIALGALAALFVLNYQEKTVNDAIVAALTTSLGFFGGLLAPSPVGDGQQAG